MAIAKTSAKALDTTERRAYILRLRREGMTYEEIVQKTIEHFGVDNLPECFDRLYAYKDVKRELDKLHKEMHEDALMVREIELQRLDEMLQPMLKKAKSGDAKAVMSVIRIMDRRAKLMGLDAPETTQNIDLSALTEEQLQRLVNGEPLLNVLGNASASRAGAEEEEEQDQD